MEEFLRAAKERQAEREAELRQEEQPEKDWNPLNLTAGKRE